MTLTVAGPTVDDPLAGDQGAGDPVPDDPEELRRRYRAENPPIGVLLLRGMRRVVLGRGQPDDETGFDDVDDPASEDHRVAEVGRAPDDESDPATPSAAAAALAGSTARGSQIGRPLLARCGIVLIATVLVTTWSTMRGAPVGWRLRDTVLYAMTNPLVVVGTWLMIAGLRPLRGVKVPAYVLFATSIALALWVLSEAGTEGYDRVDRSILILILLGPSVMLAAIGGALLRARAATPTAVPQSTEG